MAAVEQLSQEIVQSQSLDLSNSGEMRVQLADRLEKLHGLASFLAASGKLSLLSQNVLRRLSSDAELVAAAIDIWDYYCTALDDGISLEGSLDPLANAVRDLVEATPHLDWKGDLIRSFFRRHLQLLNQVLARLSDYTEAETTATTNPRAALISLNHIFLVSATSHSLLIIVIDLPPLTVCLSSGGPLQSRDGLALSSRLCTHFVRRLDMPDEQHQVASTAISKDA